ncbi:hypothetical protein Dsin_018906, partial [Dipteronia sinensis]
MEALKVWTSLSFSLPISFRHLIYTRHRITSLTLLRRCSSTTASASTRNRRSSSSSTSTSDREAIRAIRIKKVLKVEELRGKG